LGEFRAGFPKLANLSTAQNWHKAAQEIGTSQRGFRVPERTASASDVNGHIIGSMSHQFTSLRHSLEKLQEAEHFLARMAISQGIEFQFELNAFLSAARSVTFVTQKSLAHVPPI
jgi:hypothetical protein